MSATAMSNLKAVLGRLKRFAKGRDRHLPVNVAMSIGGETVQFVLPLGYSSTPGRTKAGRLSLKGRLNGGYVKVYETFCADHTAFRLAIEQTEFGRRFLPRVVAAEGSLIVERWIDGDHPRLNDSGAEMAVADILRLFARDPELADLTQARRGGFCYIDNLLVPRVERWRAIEPVAALLDRWHRQFALARPNLETRVSHPDLTLANLVRDRSGQFVVIDNELLGIGPGWILDFSNSLLASSGRAHSSYQDLDLADPSMVAITKQLRYVGTALIVGDVRLAAAIAQERG